MLTPRHTRHMKLKTLNSEIDAVIFDLDGTLVDSMWMWTDIDIEYLSRFGYEFDRQLQIDIAGMSVTETAQYFKEKYGIPRTIEEIIGDWIEMSFDKYKNEVRLKVCALKLLDHFRAQGLKTGIASSNAINMIEVCLEANGVRDRFDTIVTSDQVEHGKPFPDVYLRAAENLRTEPDRCLVFEDIPAGITAARAAGMKVIAVYDRFSEEADEEKRRLADMYCYDFSEFMKAEGISTD